MKDLVSIVVSCYNYGRFLSGCVESALAQTYPQTEIIVVDDGSTDNTGEIMKGFSSNPKIQYVKQSNAGQANAKNTGVRHSKGEYVAFLDADDLWVKDKLEKQMRLFANPRVGVAYSRLRLIGEDHQPVVLEIQPDQLLPKKGRVTSDLLFDNFLPFSSSVARKICFEKFGLFDESLKMGIDWDLWLRFSTEFEFDYVDEPLLLYRFGHEGQMSKKQEERAACADRIIEKFQREHPDAVSERAMRKVNAYTYCSRGYYYHRLDRKKSNEFYFLALKERWFQITAYRGLLKNCILDLLS